MLLTTLVLLPCFVNADVDNIDSSQLLELKAQGAVVIDVRRSDEWHKTGVIEDTHTVTFFDKYGGFDADKWLREIAAFATPDKPVVLICHAGVRSLWIADWMDQHTEFNQIYKHPPGISGWMYEGRPLVGYQ